MTLKHHSPTPGATALKFISLFSGIGGLDLGLERAGMECVAQVEIDPFCRSILARHWPNVPLFGDVKDYHPVGSTDVVVGGFPCQDISLAGYHAGLSGERSGLFWEAMRVFDEAHARYVILENVASLLTSNDGRDFGTILEALASRGLAIEWSILTACSVGAPHVRRRLFIVAYPVCDVREVGLAVRGGEQEGALWAAGDSERVSGPSDPWADAPAGFNRVADGLSNRMVKATGNAVVPQLAELIGRRLMQAHR